MMELLARFDPYRSLQGCNALSHIIADSVLSIFFTEVLNMFAFSPPTTFTSFCPSLVLLGPSCRLPAEDKHVVGTNRSRHEMLCACSMCACMCMVRRRSQHKADEMFITCRLCHRKPEQSCVRFACTPVHNRYHMFTHRCVTDTTAPSPGSRLLRAHDR